MTTRSHTASPRFLGSRLLLLAGSAATTVMLLAPVAFAADPAGHGDHGAGHAELSPLPGKNAGLTTAVTALVVFSIVSIILLTVVWPKVAKGLDDRNNKIREEIESAEMARKQAKDALEQYQNSLAQARAEAQKMLDQTRAQQAAMADDLKKKADIELGQMREKAMRDIESAKKAAVGEIYAQAAELAGVMAGKILRKNISVDDQSRLIEETISQMNSRNN